MTDEEESELSMFTWRMVADYPYDHDRYMELQVRRDAVIAQQLEDYQNLGGGDGDHQGDPVGDHYNSSPDGRSSSLGF